MSELKPVIKVLIAGSRCGCSQAKLDALVDAKLKGLNLKYRVVIVSGHANGIDKQGETYATSRGYMIEYHVANWDEKGKAAGHIRNAEMGSVANFGIIIWDYTSPGTRGMIVILRKKNIKHIVRHTKGMA